MKGTGSYGEDDEWTQCDKHEARSQWVVEWDVSGWGVDGNLAASNH